MTDVDVGVLPLDAALASLRDRAREMGEEEFRAFYDRTARGLWAYLARTSGDPRAADDLLQETYYRYFRAGISFETEAHRRNYLFRIATNLVRDRARRHPGAVHVELREETAVGAAPAERLDSAADLSRALTRLKPRQREILWLAYAEGASHEEIARAVGVRAENVKSLLFRARRTLAALLKGSRG